MPRIEDFDLPLAFKVNPLSAPLLDRPSDSEDTGEIAVQVQVRTLEGMQKEAVLSSNGGNTWRMVCRLGSGSTSSSRFTSGGMTIKTLFIICLLPCFLSATQPSRSSHGKAL